MNQRECVCITIAIFKASFPKSCSDPAKLVGTMDTLWMWIVLVMYCLFENSYADLDPFGKPFERAGQEILPDGYFCFVYSVLGDMDYYQKDLGLPNQANFDPNPACGHCTANTSTHNWFDFKPGSTWRASLPGARPSYHPIYDVKGFTTWHFAIDWLHIMDLGTASHAIGNVLYDIVFVRLSHLGRQRAMHDVTQYIYDGEPTEHGRLPPTLDIKNFVDEKKHLSAYPCLVHLKAAEVRALVPRIEALAKDYCDGSPHSKHMSKLMTHLASMYDIMHECGHVLGNRWRQFDTSMTSFLLEYSWLANNALEAVPYLPRWSVVPKHHYAVHLAQQAILCNPKCLWTYGGEDFVGRISDLAGACLKGTASFRVASSLMERYRYAMHMSLCKRI